MDFYASSSQTGTRDATLIAMTSIPS